MVIGGTSYGGWSGVTVGISVWGRVGRGMGGRDGWLIKSRGRGELFSQLGANSGKKRIDVVRCVCGADGLPRIIILLVVFFFVGFVDQGIYFLPKFPRIIFKIG